MFTSNRVPSGFRAETIKALVVFVFLTGCLLPNCGRAQQPSKAGPTAETSLKSFLQGYLGKPESKEDGDDQYLAAWVDLNDDGKLGSYLAVNRAAAGRSSEFNPLPVPSPSASPALRL